MKYLMQDEAVKEVEAVVASAFPGYKASVYCWGDGPAVGVRVAEVSITKQDSKGMQGASWMDADCRTLAVCAAAERAILSRMVCTGYDDEEQELEVEDADWRLKELLKGESK